MLLAIGELLADCISQEYVESLADARNFSIFQGGSPANVCANAQWLGLPTMLVSCVGKDGVGDMLVKEIAKSGLSTNHIYRHSEFPSSLVLVGRSKGTPDFIAYRMADAHIPKIEEKLIMEADILHSCAFALSLEPARGHILQAFKKGADMGKTISVDWNFAPSIWGKDDGRAVFSAICSFSPLLKFSMDDVERFWGITEHREALRQLDSFTSQLTCLTMGADGVWFRIGKGSWEFLAAEKVDQVVDTTGAGDAFWSGVLTAWHNRKEPVVCVREGLRVAAMKVQHMGPLYDAH